MTGLERLARFGPPLLLTAVATLQLLGTLATPLTRWRGGGFGMYSEIHPDARRLWVEGQPLGCEGAETDAVSDVDALVRRALRAPTRGHLARVAEAAARARDLSSCTGVELEAFGLAFDPARRVVSWRSLARLDVPADLLP